MTQFDPTADAVYFTHAIFIDKEEILIRKGCLKLGQHLLADLRQSIVFGSEVLRSKGEPISL